MKRCELCKGKARILCESDQASLCWNCDARVHSANFLVARHSRNLLCHVCHSPTPWSASGTELRRTFAACEQCVDERKGGESDEEDEDAEADGVEEEVVEENQVVPWSPPPPVPESSSSNDDSVTSGDAAAVSRKRYRIEIASSDLLLSDEDPSYSSSQPQPAPAADEEDLFVSPPQKVRNIDLGRVGARGTRILDSLRRLHREETDSGEEMTEHCTIHETVDLNLPKCDSSR